MNETTPTDASPAEPTHCVVVNEEEQYSLWPREKEIPAGWKEVFEGSKESCLEFVEENWTDMRPKSVREGDA